MGRGLNGYMTLIGPPLMAEGGKGTKDSGKEVNLSPSPPFFVFKIYLI